MSEPEHKRRAAALAGLALAAVVLAGLWFLFNRAERPLAPPPPAPSAAPAGDGLVVPGQAEVPPRAPGLAAESAGAAAEIEVDWLPPALRGGDARRLGFRFGKEPRDEIPDFVERLERFVELVQADRFGEANAVLEGLLDEASAAGRESLAEMRKAFLYSWGVRLLSQGNPAQAALVLSDLEALAPDHGGTQQYLGLAYYSLGEKERAYEHLSRAAKPDGPTPLYAFELGELLYLRNQLGEARAALRVAEQGPRAGEARDLLGRLGQEYTIEGRFREIVGNEEGHFSIVFDGSQNAQAAYGARVILEQARRDVGRKMGFYPSDRIAAVLYTRVQYNMALNAPDWSGALYDGKIRLPTGGLGSNALPLRDTIYHEYVHAVVQRMGGGGVPTWLHEGLAQMLEPGATGYRYQEYAKSPPSNLALIYLTAGFGHFPRGQVGPAYAYSQSFVGYLIGNHGGLSRMGRLLGALREGSTANEALQSTYGIGQDLLETRWRQAIERSRR